MELKAVSELDDVHLVQLKNYLEVFGLEVGLLLNFGRRSLEFKRLRNRQTLNWDFGDYCWDFFGIACWLMGVLVGMGMMLAKGDIAIYRRSLMREPGLWDKRDVWRDFRSLNAIEVTG